MRRKNRCFNNKKRKNLICRRQGGRLKEENTPVSYTHLDVYKRQNYKRGIIENAFKPELSNGALMDIGVYVVACMIRLFGAPVSIKASGIKLSNGADGDVYKRQWLYTG